jgi:uncharacterized membrane protein
MSDDPAGQAPDGAAAEAPDGDDPTADAALGGTPVADAPDGVGPGANRSKRGRSWLVRSGHLEFDRVLFFSDAIFAIAITVLALDLLRVSAGGNIQAGHELRTSVPGIVSFAISFAVIGLFWLGHHSLFRHIVAFDRPLMLLNLLFLGTIAFLPFPTALLGLTSTNQAPAVIFYALCCSAAGLVEAAVWMYGTRPDGGLAAPSAAQVRLPYLLQTVRAPVIFLLSIPVALYSPTLATYTWILIFVAGVVLSRLVPRDQRKGI